MIKVGDQKISISQAKEFFKITNSTPRDLISWLNRTISAEYPCNQERYKDEFTFYQGTDLNFIDLPYNYITFPENINIYNILQIIQEDKKAFLKFKKDLRQLKITKNEKI
jgi:hypothetical protein